MDPRDDGAAKRVASPPSASPAASACPPRCVRESVRPAVVDSTSSSSSLQALYSGINWCEIDAFISRINIMAKFYNSCLF